MINPANEFNSTLFMCTAKYENEFLWFVLWTEIWVNSRAAELKIEDSTVLLESQSVSDIGVNHNRLAIPQLTPIILNKCGRGKRSQVPIDRLLCVTKLPSPSWRGGDRRRGMRIQELYSWKDFFGSAQIYGIYGMRNLALLLKPRKDCFSFGLRCIFSVHACSMEHRKKVRL